MDLSDDRGYFPLIIANYCKFARCVNQMMSGVRILYDLGQEGQKGQKGQEGQKGQKGQKGEIMRTEVRRYRKCSILSRGQAVQKAALSALWALRALFRL